MTIDEGAIRELVKQLEAAWNAGDSISRASHFTDDAIFIHIFGGQLDGRVAIEAVHRQIFDTTYRGSLNNYSLQRIRFIRPDVAIVLVRAHLKFQAGDEAREIHARPTMVASKENGRLQIVAFQNTNISEMPVAAHAEGHPASWRLVRRTFRGEQDVSHGPSRVGKPSRLVARVRSRVSRSYVDEKLASCRNGCLCHPLVVSPG